MTQNDAKSREMTRNDEHVPMNPCTDLNISTARVDNSFSLELTLNLVNGLGITCLSKKERRKKDKRALVCVNEG
jgi:hypothetical protein